MTDVHASPVGTHVGNPAARTLFALLVASHIGVVVFALWEPPFDGSIRYDDIAPIRNAYWPMNVLLGGPAYALSAITGAAFLAVLGAGRGRAATLVGAVLHLIAGVVFALVITAEVLPFAWAADPSLIDQAQGRDLFDRYNDHLDAFLPYILGSMAVAALGALLALIGVTLSGALKPWVPAAALLIIVALFALPLGNPLTVPVDLAQRALWIYVGWRGLQALLDRA